MIYGIHGKLEVSHVKFKPIPRKVYERRVTIHLWLYPNLAFRPNTNQ
jgi:hypothetical protein